MADCAMLRDRQMDRQIDSSNNVRQTQRQNLIIPQRDITKTMICDMMI